MGKNKWTRHVDHEDENIHPGCMWGLIHAFGYHSWHSRVKKKSLPRIGSKSFLNEIYIWEIYVIYSYRLKTIGYCWD